MKVKDLYKMITNKKLI